MPVSVSLIGRDAELAVLESAIERARAGEGSLLLLSGEAGVGKTRLAGEAATRADALFLVGRAHEAGTEPYAPIVAALRSYLHAVPSGLDACGPLRTHLATLLPELGDATPAGDRATLLESLRCALTAVSQQGPAVVLLDDLHWSDEATLEALVSLASALRDLRIAVIAAYRADELGRDHPLRRLRGDLRRQGLLDELELKPLAPAATAALAQQVLGAPLAPRLATTIADRTQGVPFFVEELAGALADGGLVRTSDSGVELADDGELPVPSTVRDAVLMRAAALSPEARAAADVAAVAGESFDLELVASMSSEAGVLELIESGMATEQGGGTASFRHALTRDALYADIAWLNRRALHRRLAESLSASGGPPLLVAGHWLGARDEAPARGEYVRALDDFAAARAHRDAARAGRAALELWPNDDAPDERLAVLERFAHCSELGGELAEAGRAWREVVGLRQSSPGRELGVAESRLARVYELQGDRERATAARQSAADSFAGAGLNEEEATERLVVAAHLGSAGDHANSVINARAAAERAASVARLDLQVRALGLEGAALAKRGEFDAGLDAVKRGLSLALEHELTAEAADAYQRMGTVLETAADYRGAAAALESALALCDITGAGDGNAHVQVCHGCMAYVLREMGDWDRAADLCATLQADPSLAAGTRIVADGVLGAIHAFRGDSRAARPLLDATLHAGGRLRVVSMTVDAAAALAWVEDIEGNAGAAAEYERFLLDRWRMSEDRHYAVWGLRAAASSFAARGDATGTRECAEALAQVASDSGHADALAALACALGESALLDGDPDTAADQFGRALDLHHDLDIPFERAQIALRAGVAAAAAGGRELAIERLAEAHRIARRLRARPLAVRAAAEVAKLGESLDRRLGRRAAADYEGSGLTRRELEVMRLVAVGMTNREIARDLVLSPRTVDMHVRSILGKLGCRSRVEATTRAHTLGIVG